MDVFTYMSQTLNALNYLHTDQNLVHLDVKPENVILDSKSNSVKLIDFGCAQSLARIQNKMIGGSKPACSYESTEFLAPELVKNAEDSGDGDVGTSTDMWAFAVLVYVALR